MASFVTFKAMLGRYKCGAFIPVTIVVALIFGLSFHCKKSSPQNTGRSIQSKERGDVSDFVSIDIDKELSDRIKQLVRGLEYPAEVAEEFTRMDMAWKDEQKRSVVIRWKEKLSNAHQDYQQGKISRRKVAKIEEDVLEELCRKIKKQFGYKNLVFELSDVIRNQQANCLGYSQLIYIAGNAIGLSVRPIDVLDFAISPEGDDEASHIACIVDLSDGRSVMADVLFFETPSRAFKLEDHFAKVGNYQELRYEFNRLGIHRRIRLLDRKGLLAAIHNNRGSVYNSKGEYGRAILEYNKAIKIDPTFINAYNNRGNSYRNKREYDRAILDYTKAVKIDPRYASAYNNRGGVYADKGDFERAIQDLTKAVEIDTKFAMAYNNRGTVFDAKGEHDRAILDYGVAIELNPKYAAAYCNRGRTYIDKDEFDRAILDLTKAIELNPKLVDAYIDRGGCYYKKGEYDRAILDLNQAIELNPKNANAYMNRGVIYADKREFDRAILDYDKAIEIDPDYALACLNRAEVYAKLGKSEEAKEDLLKALELDPELRESAKEVSEQYELDLKID